MRFIVGAALLLAAAPAAAETIVIHVAVDGDPLADASAVTRVDCVMVKGKPIPMR